MGLKNLIAMVGSALTRLGAHVYNTPSLLLNKPAPPPWAGTPKPMSKRDRAVNRKYLWLKRWDSLKFGHPLLTGKRLERTIDNCSPAHLLVPCRGLQMRLAKEFPEFYAS